MLSSDQPSAPDQPGAPTGSPPSIPGHQLLRRIAHGSYGEIWLARTELGAFRAVKIIRRANFSNARPFDREFAGIQRYEPISREHEGLAGQTWPTLSLTGVVPSQAGTYSVSVTNALGTSATAVLSVLDLKMFAGLVLAGPVGSHYQIDYLNAIGGTNAWQPLTNVTLTVSPSVFFDADSPNHPQRFYRALLVP